MPLESDKIGIILGVISVLLGIIAIIQAAKIRRLERKLNTEAGMYERAELELQIYEKYMPGDRVCFFYPMKDYEIIFSPLPICIANTGKRPAKSVELVLDGPKFFLQSHELSIQYNETLSTPTYKVLSETQNKIKIAFAIESVHAESAFGIGIDLPLFKGGLKHEIIIPLKTKDNVNLNAQVELKYLGVIDAWLRCDNFRPITKQITVGMKDTSETDIQSQLFEEATKKYLEYRKTHRSKLISKILDIILLRFSVSQEITFHRYVTFEDISLLSEELKIGRTEGYILYPVIKGSNGLLHAPSLGLKYNPNPFKDQIMVIRNQYILYKKIIVEAILKKYKTLKISLVSSLITLRANIKINNPKITKSDTIDEENKSPNTKLE